MTEIANAPQLGEVWRYPYVWARQDAAGETEGRKHRPCAVALLTRNAQDEPVVLFVPLTTQPQDGNPYAIEVPEIEKRRAGLQSHIRVWAVLSEHNLDAYERSFYLEPASRMGAFGMSFVKQMQALKIQAIKGRKSATVKRN